MSIYKYQFHKTLLLLWVSLSTEPLGPLEGMTVSLLFINIELGLNAIYVTSFLSISCLSFMARKFASTIQVLKSNVQTATAPTPRGTAGQKEWVWRILSKASARCTTSFQVNCMASCRVLLSTLSLSHLQLTPMLIRELGIPLICYQMSLQRKTQLDYVAMKGPNKQFNRKSQQTLVSLRLVRMVASIPFTTNIGIFNAKKQGVSVL